MSDIVAFIEARLAEDEGATKAATQGAWEVLELDGELSIRADQSAAQRPRTEFRHVSEDVYDRADADHIARWDPARVLAETAAKRKRLQLCIDAKAKLDDVLKNPGRYGPTDEGNALGRHAGFYVSVRLDAMAYADHPDYDPAWRIGG